jgi:hypothetical protein
MPTFHWRLTVEGICVYALEAVLYGEARLPSPVVSLPACET